MHRDIDFFSAYRRPIDARGSVDKVTLAGAVIVAAAVVAVFGGWGVLRLSAQGARMEIDSARAYLARPDVVAAGKKIAAGREKIAGLSQYSAVAKSAQTAFEALPKLDSGLLGVLAKCEPAGMNVTGVDFGGSVLTLTCNTGDDTGAAVFTKALRETGRFSSVSYNSLNKGSDGNYYFSVACVLS